MPPLGLLAVGGPLLDAGHAVRLIDAEIGPLRPWEIAAAAREWRPDVLLLGHSGSASAHPSAIEVAAAVKAELPDVRTIYGGIFPTYHAADILAADPEIDFIVRGEGEATVVRLVAALGRGALPGSVPGIAWRSGGRVQLSEAAPLIRNLDGFRVGWELIPDWDRYQYWGAGRSAVVQFSRGCPHRCGYCGQRGFWGAWRHRDPRKVAAEIGRLHREHGVRFVDLADENPTSSRVLWREFLEALAAERVPVELVATMRADDIVRDADILHLYKKAGFSRILLGVETTDPGTLQGISKDSSVGTDRQAVRLLRQHNILSQVAYVVGFRPEKDGDFLRALRQLLSYDPDQINAMYATPWRWTSFYRENAGRRVMETDRSRWDYRQQVLAAGIPAWRVLMWVKLTEAVLQLRPRALWRVLAHRDPALRCAMRWCYGAGARAWFFELRQFIFRRRRTVPRECPTLAEFWGPPQSDDLAAGCVETEEPAAFSAGRP